MQLQEQLAIVRSHQNKIPIHVVPIAEELGLKVYKLPSMSADIAGMIRKEGKGEYAIYVNAKDAYVRRRFTIAHEIAHYILHEELIGDGIVDDPQYRSGLSTRVEVQANKLAADILMPWHLLNERMTSAKLLEELAVEFEVSNDAMSIRVLGVPYSHNLVEESV